MTCAHCSGDIPDDAAFCQFCGKAQTTNDGDGADRKVLRRSTLDRRIAGVCGGIAGYFGIDPVIVRVAWVVLTIVPGVIFLGVVAYLVAWLIIPEEVPESSAPQSSGNASSWRSKRLSRSVSNQKIGGVCGGIGEYFVVDPTAVRLLWVVLTIFPGAILCGVLAYIAAWIIMPLAPSTATQSPVEQAPA